MFRSVVVPIDLAQPSSWSDALPRGRELAGNGLVTVVAVIPDLGQAFESLEASASAERMVARSRKRLAEIVESAAKTPGSMRQELRTGSIAHEIIQAAKTAHADLIVLSSGRPEATEIGRAHV